MRLSRLLNVGLAELLCRGRQGTSKRLDRFGVAGRTSGRPDALWSQLARSAELDGIRRRAGGGDRAGAGRLLLERFRQGGPPRFFEGAVSEATTGLLADRMPVWVPRARQAAEAVVAGRFDLLGYRDLRFGDPPDWHLDPVSGRRSPRDHWSQLNPLDPAVVGDSKVVWELNRHQWLVHLGQAYRLTGDERYARTFRASVRAWMAANPPGTGINWTSSLEVALRLIAWCWALFLFRDAEALTPGLFLRLLAGVLAHATHVERYLSYYFSPNTHLTGEALGLFYAGVVFPECRAAARWRRLGLRILLRESKRQVLDDGVYFEQSTCYQRYTLDAYLHLMILAERNGVTLPAEVGARVGRMLDFLLAVRHPDGTMPPIGDADGGSLLPLAPRAPEDFRGVFSTGAALFGRADYAWAAGGAAPETLWLLGPRGLRSLDALRPHPPVMPPSRLFAEGGYAVMRSGWDAEAHQLVLDVGPLGCPWSGGHGHADLLSIQCAVFGTPCLVDPGTYGYTVEPEWRDFFRGSVAHSTVTVDGLGQAAPAGAFRWAARPRARLHRWVSTEAWDFADASHDGYGRLGDPVTHRRRVLFVKPRYWLVVDDLRGAAEHRVELRFQFAPAAVSVDPELWARARTPDGRGLLVRPFAPVPLKGEIHEGELAPIRGWVSPEYGQRRPAPLVIYSAVAGLPLRVVTVLWPTPDPAALPPAVSPLTAGGPGPAGVVFEETRERVRFDETGFQVERG